MGREYAEIPDKLYFKIGEVSELTGIKAYVLRYWETEFPLGPKKSRTGQRLYRREDIEKVRLISRLLYDEGFTIAGARRHLAEGVETTPEVVEVAAPAPSVPGLPPAPDREVLLKVRGKILALKERIHSARRVGNGA